MSRSHRLFFFFLAVLSIGGLSLVSLAYAQKTSCRVSINKPYKSPDRPSVYYISSDCKKRPIRNPAVYFSHFTSWSDVRVISRSLLESIPDHPLSFLPWGPRKEFVNGSLVKTVDDPRIYLLIDEERYPLDSADIFLGLGYQWGWVEDVDSSVLSTKAAQPTITTPSDYPGGLIFKYSDRPEVYRLERDVTGVQVKRRIETIEELSQEYRLDRVAVLASERTFADAIGPAPVRQISQTTPPASQTTDPSQGTTSNSTDPTTIGISDITRVVSRSALSLQPLGQWFTDTPFGVRFRRITDRVNSGGFGTQIYSQLQAFSADNQYILLIENEGYVVRRLDTLAKVSVDLPDVNAPRWQPARPNMIVSYDTNADATIKVLYSTVNSNMRAETIFTFPAAYQRIRGNQSNDELSHDGRWMTGMATMANGDQMMFALDLQDGRLGAQMSLNGLYNSACTRDPQYGAVEPDWVAAAPSGRYLVVQWTRDGTSRCSGLETFDIRTGAFVGRVHSNHQHGDLGTDSQGDFFMTFETEDTPNGDPHIGVRRLPGPATGVASRQLLLRMDWSQSGAHISCQATAPFCSVVTEGSPTQALGGEIILQYTDGRVLRVAHHRSTSCGYWVQPRATVSRDARYIAFASDWGVSRCAASNDNLGRGEAYLLELPANVKNGPGVAITRISDQSRAQPSNIQTRNDTEETAPPAGNQTQTASRQVPSTLPRTTYTVGADTVNWRTADPNWFSPVRGTNFVKMALGHAMGRDTSCADAADFNIYDFYLDGTLIGSQLGNDAPSFTNGSSLLSSEGCQKGTFVYQMNMSSGNHTVSVCISSARDVSQRYCAAATVSASS